jgi:hypothetical protein
MVRAPYCANIRKWISADLTPSAHRKFTPARCSSTVQSLIALCHVTELWNAALGWIHVIPCAHVLRDSTTLLFLPRNFEVAFTF